jgi:type II secretory pathway pseudopilin PulG
MRLHHRRSTLGFSLIEACVAVGIVALIAAIGIPTMQRSRSNAKLNSSAREALANLRQARTISVMRRQNAFGGGGGGDDGQGSPPPQAPPQIEPQPINDPQSPSDPSSPPPPSAPPLNGLPAGDPGLPGAGNGLPVIMQTSAPIYEAELVVLSRTSYSIVAIAEDGERFTTQVVDFLIDDPGSTLQISRPNVGETIRYRSGVKTNSSPTIFELTDMKTNKRTRIDIGAAGTRIRF